MKKSKKINLFSILSMFFIFVLYSSYLLFAETVSTDMEKGLTAELTVERVRGFKVTPTAIHFGTYKSSQGMPATQSVEVSIMNNVVEPAFHINLSCEKGFVNSVSGNVIIGSPQFFISKPVPKNPEDFQQARGTSVYCPQDPAYRGYIGVCSQDYDTGGTGAEICFRIARRSREQYSFYYNFCA